MKEKDLAVLTYFRTNSRTSLTKLSRDTKVPVSTIYDRLKEYEKSNLIKKHTSLIDFKMLGFNVRSQILICADKLRKDELQRFLCKHPNVNNILRISNGFDFLVEAIFKNLEELDVFSRQIDEFEVKEKQEFFVMEDLKREEFLSYNNNLALK
jgi:DNA-binding Lrp family transcriptional regulator